MSAVQERRAFTQEAAEDAVFGVKYGQMLVKYDLQFGRTEGSEEVGEVDDLG